MAKKTVSASAATKVVRNKRLVRVEAYNRVFNGPNGELVLRDLMETHHMLGSTFTKDSNEMVFREGERNVVLRILSILKVDVNELRERMSNVPETDEQAVV